MTGSTVTLVATLTHRPEAAELAALAGRADLLEVRADLTGDLDAAFLREHFPGRLLYTLRSRDEGGAASPAGERRRRRLVAAASGFDLVDLEGRRDAVEEVLEALPKERRIVSWHGGPATLAELQRVLSELEEIPARYFKLVPEAKRPGQELSPLALLHSLGRRDLIAFASGPAASWTRALAPRLGAPVAYGAVSPEAGAPGQPTLERLRGEFGFPAVPPDRLYGVVGHPVEHSLSPRLHNGLYRELGIDALYLPLDVEAFGDFWLEVVESGSLAELGFDLGGLSVTAPHKEIALAVSGAPSPLAERIGSANTLVRRGAVWEAESTDAEGILGPLRARGVACRGLGAAVVGAGGAGRAAAFALAGAGASVCLVNRSVDRGRKVARELGVAFLPLDELDPGRFDLVVHATPAGRGGEKASPVDPARLSPDAVVVDLVYRDGEPTPLVRRAAARGIDAVDGREVLLAQALPQFRLMTGREAPAGVAAELLGLTARGAA